jgi:lipoate-protein ligase B
MFDLNRLKWHVRTLVSFAEQAMIEFSKNTILKLMPNLMHQASMLMVVKSVL